MWTDGLKKINTSEKSDTTSPITATDLVLITTTMDAYDNCDVVVVDVPGRFITAIMDKDVILVIEDMLLKFTETVSTIT